MAYLNQVAAVKVIAQDGSLWVRASLRRGFSWPREFGNRYTARDTVCIVPPLMHSRSLFLYNRHVGLNGFLRTGLAVGF